MQYRQNYLFPIIQKINKEGEELLDISNGSDDTRELADVINLLEVKTFVYMCLCIINDLDILNTLLLRNIIELFLFNIRFGNTLSAIHFQRIEYQSMGHDVKRGSRNDMYAREFHKLSKKYHCKGQRPGTWKLIEYLTKGRLSVGRIEKLSRIDDGFKLTYGRIVPFNCDDKWHQFNCNVVENNTSNNQ